MNSYFLKEAAEIVKRAAPVTKPMVDPAVQAWNAKVQSKVQPKVQSKVQSSYDQIPEWDRYKTLGPVSSLRQDNAPATYNAQPKSQLGYQALPDSPEYFEQGYLTSPWRTGWNIGMTGMDALWARDCAKETFRKLPTQRAAKPATTRFSRVLPKSMRQYQPWAGSKGISSQFRGAGNLLNTPAFALSAGSHVSNMMNPNISPVQRTFYDAPMAAANTVATGASMAEFMRPGAYAWAPRLMGATALASIPLEVAAQEADGIRRGAQNLQNQNQYYNNQENNALGLFLNLTPTDEDNLVTLPAEAQEDAFTAAGLQDYPYVANDPALRQRVMALANYYSLHNPATVNTDPTDHTNHDTTAFGGNGFWTNVLAPGAKDTVAAVRRHNAENVIAGAPEYLSHYFDEMAQEDPNAVKEWNPDSIVMVPSAGSGRLVPMRAGEVYNQIKNMYENQFRAKLPTTGSGYLGNARIAGYVNPADANRLLDQMPQDLLPRDPAYEKMCEIYDSLSPQDRASAQAALSSEEAQQFDSAGLQTMWQTVVRNKQEEAARRQAEAEEAQNQKMLRDRAAEEWNSRYTGCYGM